jgi:hypothetical protein
MRSVRGADGKIGVDADPVGPVCDGMRSLTSLSSLAFACALCACGDDASQTSDTPLADTVAVDASDTDAMGDTSAPDTTAPDVDEVADAGDVSEGDATADGSDIATDTAATARALTAEGEALFFRAMAGELTLRKTAIDKLAAGLALDPEQARGQLVYGMALLSAVAEDGDLFSALKAGPALEKAMQLAPEDLRIPGWLGTIKVGTARALNQPEALDDAIAFMIAATDAYPEFNSVSLAIALSHLPLDTIYPQMAIDRLVGTADCAANLDVCKNTAKVPHNNEGALMLFGDVYARIGDAENARHFYTLALTSPDAATWKYAPQAQAVLDDLDHRIDLYLDADPANDPLFFAEGRVACVGCHAP